MKKSLIIGALLIPLLIILFIFPPTPTSYYPKCVLYSSTGIHCPGCGTARCLHALTHGHVLQALAYNVATVTFVILYPLWLIYRYGFQRKDSPKPIQQSPWVPWTIFVLFMLFWILRNIPVYPFSILAPHELPN